MSDPYSNADDRSVATERRERDTVMLVLSYLGLLALIPYLTVRDSDYVRWHSKQGLTLCVVWIGVSIALGMLAVIPGIGLLIGLVSPFLSIGIFALGVVAIVKALQGERWRIPLVADLTDQW